MKDSHHHCQQYFKVWTCMQNETERAIDTDGKLNSESPGMMFASFTCKINDKVRVCAGKGEKALGTYQNKQTNGEKRSERQDESERRDNKELPQAKPSDTGLPGKCSDHANIRKYLGKPCGLYQSRSKTYLVMILANK